MSWSGPTDRSQSCWNDDEAYLRILCVTARHSLNQTIMQRWVWIQISLGGAFQRSERTGQHDHTDRHFIIAHGHNSKRGLLKNPLTWTIQPTRPVSAEFLHCKKLKSCHIKAVCDSYVLLQYAGLWCRWCSLCLRTRYSCLHRFAFEDVVKSNVVFAHSPVLQLRSH